ncbi:type I-G CRISPR-associated helicase/endonuclease Cas3g [Desulfogranum mediterraneum]|uniref:type I-G CRISPR-associated helicase/endonuclease Cas3g n=1 Tax=Desulfogranum mediterraneum TaxID=160661 RepID=UPI00040C9C2A|nr:type I-U CRISPR-associated helicase/endonuclease Cas3 [Desulfogranum mediterraneum]
MDFFNWYQENHGYPPFPWQAHLANKIADGQFPSSISVPTGCGKTAIIAIWHWAALHEIDVPKRLIYIVDRRLIVDSVTDYAKELGCNVVKMRGGVTIDNSWMMEPNKHSVIVSTVDQAGSRLLWRGYGVSSRVAPIHAALIGNDALLVLDEAHISTPFAKTLEAIIKLRVEEAHSWHVIAMTATPIGEGETLSLSDEDHVHPVVKKRLESKKWARLVKSDRAGFVTKMVAEAKGLQQDIEGVVGVICNTTKYARQVFERLGGDKVLLTGRIRFVDKDRILAEYLPRILSGSREDRRPLFVVATQTIEVGADLDFDALVTQSATIDALRQRFGRLDRLGELGSSSAVVVHEKLAKSEECRVYGKSLLNKTMAWLNKAQTGKGKNKGVDFGISAMDKVLAETSPPQRDVEEVRPFTASDLRQLRQTNPQVEVDIASWLHGENSDTISVSVVWRADLDAPVDQWVDIVDAAPPVMAEVMPCPYYEVRQWLGRRYVVVGENVVRGLNIKPGDLVVVPAGYGGYGEWGWNPGSREPVEDIGNRVGARIRLIGATEEDDVDSLLDQLDLEVKNPVATPYPRGLVITSSNPRTNGREVQLEEHLAGVGDVASALTDEPVVHEASRLHDIGKQDPRFQVLLGSREKVLAKSGHPSPWAARIAREWSGLPKGWRHEVASVTMLPDNSSDLLKYLVATHHGYARVVLPIGGDESLWNKAGGPTWGNMTDRLNEEYGAWGLAYLEALVRLSDWIQSEQEQNNAV